MSALVGALRVTLGANTANYEAGMRRAQNTARRTGTDISRSISQAQRTAVTAFRAIAAAAGVVSLGAAARSFLQYADAAKSLEAQLRLATRESGSFARAQEDVARIAAQTRSGLEETASLYATFQRNARELGITQEQAARATQTVSQAFLISGATAAEAAGGLRQFLQGIQSGTLRGEELNSVLENAPRLARLLADSLGVTIGQLRAMGAAGELTADKLLRALTDRRFTDGIDAEFRELPVTFDQAMTLVSNAAIETFGAFDRGGQFSNAIANFIVQGTGGMGDIADAAERAGINIRAAFDGLGDAFTPLWRGAEQAFGGINSEIFNTRLILADLLGAIDMVANAWNRAGNAVDNFGANVVEPFLRNNPWTGPNARLIPGRMFSPGTRGQSRLRDNFLTGFDASAAGSGRRLRVQDWGNAFRDARSGSAPRMLPRVTAGGGGGGSRRGGGGRGRASSGPSVGSEEWFADPRTTAAALREYNAAAEERARIEREIAQSLEVQGVEVDKVASTLEWDVDRILRDIEVPDLGSMLSVEDQERISGFAESFQRDLSSGLADAIVMGRDLGDTLVQTIQRASAALLESAIFDLLSGRGFGGKGGASGAFGFITRALGAAFGGGRAAGGPVLPNRAYLVGERGPELLAMGGAAGHVTPNHALGTINFYQTIAPNLAGNAVDRAEMIRFAAVVKQDTIASIRDLNRRRP